MKNCAANVSTSIAKMQDLCRSLKQNYPIQGSHLRTSNQKPKQNQVYSIAKQIKLLLDVPEKVWSSLDGREYLRVGLYFSTFCIIHFYYYVLLTIDKFMETNVFFQATSLFLEARHVHTSLQMDSHQATKIATWFPVLSRQWDAISHFKATILGASRDQLKNTQVCYILRYRYSKLEAKQFLVFIFIC